MIAIDADALIHELNNSHYPGAPYIDAGISIAIGKVCDAPTIEPERKTGKWIQKGLKWECDQCGCRIGRAKPFSGNMWNYYYCPNCGVKMEEGEQDGQTN